jgi:Zn-dependent M28 family amino/carboxypeptidase
VVGVLPGGDLNNEYVVISAHLDHLGTGLPVRGDSIYNGAMDNASGVASLLEIARALHESKRPLRRSIAFVAVTGEEKGLLGSRYFATHPTLKSGVMVANINLDMFLPIIPLKILTVMGLPESDLGDDIALVCKKHGVRVQADPEPDRNLFIRSDQYSFIRQGVPALAFKIGYEKNSAEAAIAKNWLTERYHAPSDDVRQPVDLQAAAAFNVLMLELAEMEANRATRPRWKAGSFFRRFAKP